MRSRRILKTIAAAGAVLSLVFLSNSFQVSAELKEVVIDGRDMWVSSSIYETSASVSTYAGIGQAKTSVDATYVYIDRRLGSPTENETGMRSSSNSGNMGSNVSFSAPSGYTSVRISASHTISCGTAYYSDSTAEDY